eukprot:352421-Chlamydomonas_euryale.AAC.30
MVQVQKAGAACRRKDMSSAWRGPRGTCNLVPPSSLCPYDCMVLTARRRTISVPQSQQPLHTMHAMPTCIALSGAKRAARRSAAS